MLLPQGQTETNHTVFSTIAFGFSNGINYNDAEKLFVFVVPNFSNAYCKKLKHMVLVYASRSQILLSHIDPSFVGHITESLGYVRPCEPTAAKKSLPTFNDQRPPDRSDKFLSTPA